MKIENMDTVNSLVNSIYIPQMFRVRQVFQRKTIDADQVTLSLKEQANSLMFHKRIKAGMNIAITAGSRHISNLPKVIKCIGKIVKELGAHPFIVPAMGSHAGATAEGQKKMLKDLGISAETTECAIKSSMETAYIGGNIGGKEVHIDRNAYEADGIIVVNRIKPHSGFRGKYESGLMKMMAVGLGKQHGAEMIHSKGVDYLDKNIHLFGETIIRNSKILFGVALLENAYGGTAEIHVMNAEDIINKEPEYLKKAFLLMPRIMVKSCDVLIIEELGKDHSGGGIDPNITGRFLSPRYEGDFKAQRIGVLNLSQKTNGNANGIGLSDIITKRAFEKIDAATTYANVITTTAYANARIPMVMSNDRLAIQACIMGSYEINPQRPKVVYIKNTADLEHIWLSEAYLDKVSSIDEMRIESPPKNIKFDGQGGITSMP